MNEDRATRYNRRRRWVSTLSVLVTGGLLGALLVTPGAVSLRDVSHRLIAGLGLPASSAALVASYVAILVALHELVSLPLGFYQGVVLDRRYGLSSQGAIGWMRDHLKASGVALGLAMPAAMIVYATLRTWPERWWIVSGLIFAGAVVGLTLLGPVLLLPLFARCIPLQRDALRERLEALARRAGTSVVGVYEWQLGERAGRANAALVGLFGTRRILVSDTLLSTHSDDEIEVVLAHELGHHVHGDIWKTVALESAMTLTGLFAAHLALGSLGPALGIAERDDVAGLPLIVLAAGLTSLLFLPLANAVSRRHERRADRFALELTADTEAFLSAMRRLEVQHLAERRPSRMVRWLFCSHPPVDERIALGEAQRSLTTSSPCISLQRSSSAKLQ